VATADAARLPLQVIQRRVDRLVVASARDRDNSSGATAKSTLTLFGAENVKSNAAVDDLPVRTARGVSVEGSLPSINAANPSVSTLPVSPSNRAPDPAHRPCASPRPA
jgi:hypothetical protein